MSWEVLDIYFENNKTDAQCAGYLKYLKSLKNLQMLSFLADILFAFQRFQKSLQSDRLTLIDMKRQVNLIKNALNGMKFTKIPRGFESQLAAQRTKKAKHS